jgi:hypothetical protein
LDADATEVEDHNAAGAIAPPQVDLRDSREELCEDLLALGPISKVTLRIDVAERAGRASQAGDPGDTGLSVCAKTFGDPRILREKLSVMP